MKKKDNREPLPDLTTGDAEDQADAWLVYLYSGAATREGEKTFKAWLKADPVHGRSFARAEQLWRDLGFTDGEDGAARINRLGPARRDGAALSPKRTRPWTVAAAASLAATLMISIGVWRLAFYAPVNEERFTSAVGEIRTVTLADGSEVTLGGATAISTAFSKRRRDVELVRGGAYFDVVTDAARPFAVRAGGAEVTVVGTAFDLRRSMDGLRVSVAEGVVAVGAAEKTINMRSSSKPLRVSAGRQTTLSMTGAPGGLSDFDPASTFAWREGRLVYVDEPLSHVVAEVNRYRADKIRLAAPELGDIRITIALPIDRTDQLLSALEATEPVTIRRSAGGVSMLLKGDSAKTER